MTVISTVDGHEIADQEPSLELIGLRRRFGPVVALDGLTFSVPPGQVFGFLGPNGAGKTTAMRAIFGVVALDAGEVRWMASRPANRPGGISGTCRRNAACTRACPSVISWSTWAACTT